MGPYIPTHEPDPFMLLMAAMTNNHEDGNIGTGSKTFSALLSKQFLTKQKFFRMSTEVRNIERQT